MFLKIIHFEVDPKYKTSPNYTLHEGKFINVIWENKVDKTPLRFVVDGAFVDIEGDGKKVIYIMNSEGKTIDKITKESKITEERLKEQRK